MAVTTTHEARKTGGVPNQAALYSKVASREKDILEALFDALSSKNEAIKIGAAKTLLNKILPDLKSVEVGGAMMEDGTRSPLGLFINVGQGFLPATISLHAPSASGSATESTNEPQKPV